VISVRPRGALRAIGLLAAAMLVLAACGDSPTAPSGGGTASVGDSDAAKAALQVYSKFNGMTGAERDKALLEAANAEGSLSIYTSNTDIDKVVEAFEDKYPDIDVSVYRANSETVLQRTLQEQEAGFYGNDILETNAGELGIANQEGLLAEYKSGYRDKVRPEGQRENWTASRFNVFVVGWNTKMLKPGEQPKSLEELADPKWKGKISLELSDVDWFAAMYGYFQKQGKSDAEIKDLFTKIASNAKVAKGHTVQGELLSAGQFAVAVSAYSHTIDKAAADGAPVTWRPSGVEPVQPLVTRPNGVAAMRTAKHPAAATLFIDFELTDTQKIFEEAFRIGAVPTAEDKLAGLETIAVPDEQLLAELKKWDDLYAEVVQQGQQLD
jgi:iron(III) transport system substrate-binding protein